MRRGHPSVNSQWNNSVAILTGDFLFAQASHILADLGPEAVRIQAETFSRLVTGQMAETIGPRACEDPLDFYMYVITEKTGSLIATSGRFGALFSGAPACGRRPDRGGLRADRRGLAALRRRDRHRERGVAVRQDARAPTCARACGRCRCSTRCALLTSPGRCSPRPTPGCAGCSGEADLTDEALLAEALTLLRGHHAMKESRADVLNG